eukprot:298560_1
MQQKRLDPFDSIYGYSDYDTICKNLMEYIEREYQNRIQNGNSIMLNGWTIQKHPEYPQQHNIQKTGVGNDCGIFTMKCAEWSAEDIPISFTQSDMWNFRQQILLDIYTFQSQFC